MAERTDDPPFVPAARASRDVIDAITLELAEARGRVDRSLLFEALDRLLRALARLEHVDSSDPDVNVCFDDARACIGDCLASLAVVNLPDESRVRARLGVIDAFLQDERAVALSALARAWSPGDRRTEARTEKAGPSPRRASLGEPRLFDDERAPLVVHREPSAPFLMTAAEDEEEDHLAIDLAEEGSLATLLGAAEFEAPPSEASLEGDDSRPVLRLPMLVEGPSGDVTRAVGADGELAYLRRVARDCLEDIGVAANLRRIGADERFEWDAMSRFEQRMCDALDALLAVGLPYVSSEGDVAHVRPGLDVVDEALRFGRDAFTADPGRCYARTFVLGSVAGDDVVRASLVALRQSPTYTHAAQAQALSLAPNTDVDSELARLCQAREVPLLRVALDALYARARGELGAVLPLVEHADDSIRARALRALGLVGEREVAIEVLLARLAVEGSDAVTAAGVEALLLLGCDQGSVIARERLQEDAASPGALSRDVRLRLMMLLGVAGGEADARVLAACYRGSSGEALALGLHGHLDLAAMLVDAIAEGSNRRTLGPESLREAAEALVRIVGAPLVDDGDVYRARTDAGAWRAWWSEFAREFDPGVRLRWGRGFSPLTVVDELEADRVPLRVRRALALELGVLLRERPVMLHAFVPSQRRDLAARRERLEAALSKGQLRLGVWPTFSASGRALLR